MQGPLPLISNLHSSGGGGKGLCWCRPPLQKDIAGCTRSSSSGPRQTHPSNKQEKGEKGKQERRTTEGLGTERREIQERKGEVGGEVEQNGEERGRRDNRKKRRREGNMSHTFIWFDSKWGKPRNGGDPTHQTCWC